MKRRKPRRRKPRRHSRGQIRRKRNRWVNAICFALSTIIHLLNILSFYIGCNDKRACRQGGSSCDRANSASARQQGKTKTKGAWYSHPTEPNISLTNQPEMQDVCYFNSIPKAPGPTLLCLMVLLTHQTGKRMGLNGHSRSSTHRILWAN